VTRTPKMVLLTKDLDSESLLVLGLDGARLYVGRLTERVAADMDMCSAKAQRPDSRRSGT